MLHYLTPEEEQAIKSKIPWQNIEWEIRELVRVANEIQGLATVQSCAGHVTLLNTEDVVKGHFHVRKAHICFRCTEKIAQAVVFGLASKHDILDVSLRYWVEGSFWVRVEAYPAEVGQLFHLFEELKNLQLAFEEQCD